MEKKTFSRLGFALAAMALSTLASQVLVSNLAAMLAPALRTAGWFGIASTALFYAVGVPVFALLIRRIPDGPALERQPVKAGAVFVFYFICMGGMYIFNYVGLGVTSLLSLLLGRTVGNPLASVLSGPGLWATVLFVGILSPIFEELAFRKLLLNKLRPFGDKTAMWFSALAFGLFHMNFSQFFYATAVGLVLAYAALKTGNIKLSVLLHVLVNFTGSVLPTLVMQTGSTILTVMVAAYMFLCIGLAILFLCVFWRKIHLNPAPCRFSAPLRGRLVYANRGMFAYYLVAGAMFALNTLLV